VLLTAVGHRTDSQHLCLPVLEDSDGVLWINDSKATNVEASLVGINSIHGRKAVVLLGGQAKVGVFEIFPLLLRHTPEKGFCDLLRLVDVQSTVSITGSSVSFGISAFTIL
jgi:hypothetical protein